MATIYKGDDTNAFGEDFIIISLKGAETLTISKVIFQCGPIQKVYTKPQFPIKVNFNHNESSKLLQNSVCYLQVFDERGRRKTCEGSLSFTAKQKVIADEPTIRRTNFI